MLILCKTNEFFFLWIIKTTISQFTSLSTFNNIKEIYGNLHFYQNILLAHIVYSLTSLIFNKIFIICPPFYKREALYTSFTYVQIT